MQLVQELHKKNPRVTNIIFLKFPSPRKLPKESFPQAQIEVFYASSLLWVFVLTSSHIIDEITVASKY